MSTEPKSNHRVNVVRINEIKKHPNADTLGLVEIGGYQAVVKLDDYKPGDLAIYIQPDSVVPEIEQFSFLWYGKVEPGLPVPEKRRRITVRKFRKEWSEGLLMPLKEFPQLQGMQRTTDGEWIPEVGPGDDVSEVLGIYHYEPPEPDEFVGPGRRDRSRPRSLKGWLHYLWYRLVLRPLGLAEPTTGWGNEKAPAGDRHVYDVEAYKNFKGTFIPGEIVVITEKVHGSNARYTNEAKKPEKIFAGSRRLWKAMGDSVWRKALAQFPGIATFLEKNPGFTVYGEVVPTQGGFEYGATKEAPKFLLFDIMDADGHWLERFQFLPNGMWVEVKPDDVLSVPVLYVGPWSEDLVEKFVDGPSLVPGANHIREGIVIRAMHDRIVRGLGRPQLKVVSNKFLEKAA